MTSHDAVPAATTGLAGTLNALEGGKTRYGPRCYVQLLLMSLTASGDTEARTALERVIDDHSVPAVDILNAVVGAGYELGVASIRRHRHRGTGTGCRCPQ